jgi:hypothetical protein
LTAVTDIVPDSVRVLDGESIDTVPVVFTKAPVKVTELLMLKAIGVITATNERL